jgi:proteasome lid subunit RPN8/RPN11
MLAISKELLDQIHEHGEQAYPEEGAGFLVGNDGEVKNILPLHNAREQEARHNRFLITPEAYLNAELTAEKLGLSLIGVFHSHPDHPNRPSEYDREWAQPFFSYIITTVNEGKATKSRSWRLLEDRSRFEEEPIQVSESEPQSSQRF